MEKKDKDKGFLPENILNEKKTIGTLIKFIFELKGNFNPAVISIEIGLEPSETWRKGDQSKYSKKILQFDYWSLDTGYINSLDLEEVLKDIYSKLNMKRSTIAQVIKNYDITCVFTVVAKIDGMNTPGLTFSEDIVKLASEFNAFFDIDLYVNEN